MFKLKTFIIIIIIYFISYLSLTLNVNLLYPYHLVKDILYYPVRAITSNSTNLINDSIILELKDDIKELKELTGIKTILSDFSLINATIIERNRSYWFNSLIIDKGSLDGVIMDMAVINKDGLIGKINKVSELTSEIKLITTNDISSKISVLIMNNNQKVYGIMNGYDDENNALLVTLTTKNIDIKEDSNVTTTGMGGIFPSGIIIGKVKGIKKDNYDVGMIVLVTPNVSMKDLKYVSVLKRD